MDAGWAFNDLARAILLRSAAEELWKPIIDTVRRRLEQGGDDGACLLAVSSKMLQVIGEWEKLVENGTALAPEWARDLRTRLGYAYEQVLLPMLDQEMGRLHRMFCEQPR